MVNNTMEKNEPVRDTREQLWTGQMVAERDRARVFDLLDGAYF